MLWTKPNKLSVLHDPRYEFTPLSINLFRSYYNTNPIVNHCICTISRGVSNIDVKTEIIKPDGYNLWSIFLYLVTTELYVTGNVFLHKNSEKLLSILDMRKVETVSNNKFKYNDKNIDNILHIKLAPSIEEFCTSPLTNISKAIEIHRAISDYIYGLVQNGGRPSGILSYENKYGSDQKTQIKEQMENMYRTIGTKGRVAIIEGQYKWEQIGLSPYDLDIFRLKEQSEFEIACGLGFPPIMLTHSPTYSNYCTARELLNKDIIIPLGNRIINTILDFLK